MTRVPPTRPIYLDAHATTPLDPRVLDAMLPSLRGEFGNASSRNHVYGREAADAVEDAREKVAAAIGGAAKEIVWTSGATESDNLALTGIAEARREKGDGIVTAVTEHPAVLDPARALAKRGFRVTILPVDRDGHVDSDELAAAIDDRTILVSIMLANNEVGTIQDVAALAKVVRARSDATIHTDAVQAAGKLPLDVEALGVDLLSLSAHKIHGPKGVGALWVRRRRPTVRLAPLLHGGGQERGFRSGTLNVPGIIGMGEAFAIAEAERADEAPRLGRLRDRLLETLRAALPDVHVNGDPVRRLPNNLNVSFSGVEAEDLLLEIPEIAVSTGAACSSASLEPSHVISALGLGEARAQSSLRFGLHRFTTEEEIDVAATVVIRGVRHLREVSPVWTDPPPGAPSA